MKRLRRKGNERRERREKRKERKIKRSKTRRDVLSDYILNMNKLLERV